jgi:hypothetical protein
VASVEQLFFLLFFLLLLFLGFCGVMDTVNIIF